MGPKHYASLLLCIVHIAIIFVNMGDIVEVQQIAMLETSVMYTLAGIILNASRVLLVTKQRLVLKTMLVHVQTCRNAVIPGWGFF